MSSFSIKVDFITGRCVAADVSIRELPEWPPHPGRLFMALAATCFETDEHPDQVAALKWLESLSSAPAVYCTEASARSRVAVYVPVNDKVTASKSLLQSVPGLSRSKQERAFPTVIPESTQVVYFWEHANGVEQHFDALQQLCKEVIRVGHSSSLVSVHATLNDFVECDTAWVPTVGRSKNSMRIVGEGEFERLRAACGAERIDAFAGLAELIGSSKGAEQKSAKAAFESRFGEPFKSSLRPPSPVPPVLGLWQGYAKRSDIQNQSIAIEGGHFDSELLVLCKLEGPNLGVHDTLALTKRLRDAAMSACNDPVPSWLSGHDEVSGAASSAPHAAFLALPFVGSKYADGHEMGVAIALPKQVSPEQRGVALRDLMFDENDDSRIVELKLGRLGEWNVRLETDNAGRQTLQNETWITPSTTWASVTPVVLDRFPKTSKTDQRQQWVKEVAETVSRSCELAGFPTPSFVDIDTTSWLTGVPRAIAKRRRTPSGDAPLGDGFPSMPYGIGKPVRPQVHVHLTFAQPVVGPVIIGAGRFRGYGLCKPILEHRRRQ